MFAIAADGAGTVRTCDVSVVEGYLDAVGGGARSLAPGFQGPAISPRVEDVLIAEVALPTLEAALADEGANVLFSYDWDGAHGYLPDSMFVSFTAHILP